MILATNENLLYMGRIDFENPERPKFIWAGSNVRMRFTGTSISAVIKNRKFYNDMMLGYVLDGKEGIVEFDENDKDITLKIGENLPEGDHEIILFKRQDATHWFEFVGFIIDDSAQVLKHAPLPERKIECFGDSVSAGAVVEAVEYTGKCDPEDNQGRFDNAWHSYSMITARNLGAQIHVSAQGGIAIFDGTGYYHAPTFIGMETAYNKLRYFPEDGGYSDWDFDRYTPNVVLFAVGQNDTHFEGHEDRDIKDPDFRAKWKARYKEIILDLRSKYKNAYFILLLTVLNHDPEWDKVIEEIKDELADEKILHCEFTRSGKATPGHPRLPEQYEMAEELTAFISKLGDKIWVQ
jgi:hypothetical protein